MKLSRRTSRKASPCLSARVRKPLSLEQRGRFWQSVGEALRAQARAKTGGNP